MTISSRQREVLLFLSQRDQWTMSELASALKISHVAVSKLLVRLERMGVVRRDIVYEDRRRVLISPTRYGKMLASDTAARIEVKDGR
ncbi:MAG: hypothetical protein PVS3B3_38100 [Ktedonobacteraceae bacterium]